MSTYLNIGLKNTGHLSINQAIKVALHMIGTVNIKETATFGVAHEAGGEGPVLEPTLVVELYCDIVPSVVYRAATALNQDCIAYYHSDDEIGLLIGPKPYDKFEPRYFVLLDGLPLDGELRTGGAA